MANEACGLSQTPTIPCLPQGGVARSYDAKPHLCRPPRWQAPREPRV